MPRPDGEITIRRAMPEDAAAIGRVFDAATRAAWTWIEQGADPMFGPHEWDDLVADHAPPNSLLVAIDPGGEVVGFTAVKAESGEMFLLFVDPEHGGRGIGKALLDAAHDAIQAAGHEQAYLFTEERNVRALAVYRAAGYEPDGTVRESDFRGVALREPRLVKRFDR